MKFIVFCLLFLPAIAQAKVLKVAVIDTGYSGDARLLCPTGQFDFVANKAQVGEDTLGHGTKVVRAIATNAKDSNYCVLMYKVFGGNNTAKNIISALNQAVKQHVDAINLSFEGPDSSAIERLTIARALTSGIQVFVAAGNKNKDLDISCNVYPACYPLKGLQVVSGLSVNGRPAGNTGHVVTQLAAFCVDSLCGTSMSTGYATGTFIYNKGR